MAFTGTLFTPTARRPVTADRVAGFTAEQRRLKAGAASRRAAAAAVADEQPGERVPGRARAKRTPAVERRSRYLQ